MCPNDMAMSGCYRALKGVEVKKLEDFKDL